MRVTRILCTLLLFGPLAVEANEATAPKDSNSPLTAVDSATGRDRDAGVAVAARPATTPSRPATTPSFPAGPPSRPAATQQIGRANADRLHSLLAAQARGRVVRQPVSHPVDSARATTFMGRAGQQRPGANVTQFGATPARQLTRGATSQAPVGSLNAGRSTPTLSGARPVPMLSAARPVPTLSALAMHSTNGHPRAPGLAVLGGPVVGRSVHSSSIDGTRLRQKF